MRTAVVLRPEPGNARTVARLETASLATVAMPLFVVAPVAWTAPDPAQFDALLLTSANAVRHGGALLDRFRALPVVAVGPVTAAAARARGFTIAASGPGGGEAAVALAHEHGFGRLLHLAGRDRTGPLRVRETIAVYASERVPIATGAMRCCRGQVVLLHSARAARRAATLIDRDRAERGTIRLAAISAAVAEAAGEGWGTVGSAAAPTDAALVRLARDLAD